MALVPDADLKAIITENKTNLLVKHAQVVGSQAKSAGLTTNQIRALFSEVRQIEAMWSSGGEQREKAYSRLILLKPKMAYRAKKEQGTGVQNLVNVLDPAVDQVAGGSNRAQQDERFVRFVNFFEAILAYHRAAGGR